MNSEMVLFIGRRCMEIALLLSAPVLIVTVVIGIVVAMFQAVTSIRDQTLGMVIKLAAVAVTLLVTGSWMLQTSIGFTEAIFHQMQALGR